MSKKNNKNQHTEKIQNYYDLKIKETDELVEVLKTSSVSEQPISTDIQEITGEDVSSKSEKARNFDPYKHDKLSFIPAWVKAIFIKWWFAGAVCFFMVFGLFNSMSALDNMVLTGIVLGVITDVMVNPIFRLMESDVKEYNNFMMFPFPFKAYWTFLTNMVYYVIVLIIVGFTYEFIGTYISDNIAVEPLLFGTICVIVDMAFIGIKDAIVYLVKKNRKKRSEEVSTDV